MSEKNSIQKAIDQIGELSVQRYLPKGLKLCNCDMHGKYLSHYTTTNSVCPLCIQQSPEANGPTATQLEHYIDLEQTAMRAFEPLLNTSGSGVHE